jgi:hypothetical protein
MTHEALKAKKYWFKEEDLIKPLDWRYIESLPPKTKLGLEIYMDGRVSLGKAAEIASMTTGEFDYVRAKARVPIRGPDDK